MGSEMCIRDRAPTHPKSSSISTPSSHSTIFILTSTHTPYELNILSGHLTPRSRLRISKSKTGADQLPAELRLQRDRAVGCIWDVQEHWERVWLYGASWLGMIDLRHSTSADDREDGADEAVVQVNGTNHVSSSDDISGTSMPQKKRKRSDTTADNIESNPTTNGTFISSTALTKKQRKTEERKARQSADQASETLKLSFASKRAASGLAGSRMRAYEEASGAVRTIDILDEEDIDGKNDLRGQNVGSLEDDDDEMQVSVDENEDDLDDDEDDSMGDDGKLAGKGKRQFVTNRYRAVLAVVPLVDTVFDLSLIHI